MRAIPAEVGARWGAMWAKGHVLDRPWWSRHDLTYRRCDGIIILSRVFMDITHGDERGLWDGKEPYADAMARIDAAHPLPHPGFYPGQVWVLDDDEVTICRVKHRDARVEAYVSPDYGAIDYSKDLLDGAILVAGPTPWGRDCPWSPA